MKAPYSPISVSKGSPERISQCSERHIQSVLENQQVFLKMARLLALSVTTHTVAQKEYVAPEVIRAKAFELLQWLEE